MFMFIICLHIVEFSKYHLKIFNKAKSSITSRYLIAGLNITSRYFLSKNDNCMYIICLHIVEFFMYLIYSTYIELLVKT